MTFAKQNTGSVNDKKLNTIFNICYLSTIILLQFVRLSQMQINISRVALRHLDPNQQVDAAHELVRLGPKK